MWINYRNILIAEVLLGAGYWIGTVTNRPTVVTISAAQQFQEVADPAARSGSLGFWLLMGGLVLLVGLWTIGRRKTKDQLVGVDENIDVMPVAGLPKVQKSLSGNAEMHLRFEDRLELAARQSRENGRVMGVICLSPHVSIADRRIATPGINKQIRALADEAKSLLPQTGGIQVTDANEIIVFAAGLRNRGDLQETARKLSAFLVEKDDSVRFAPAGLALYPLHGYTGKELIDAARRNVAFAEREQRPAPSAPLRVLSPELCT